MKPSDFPHNARVLRRQAIAILLCLFSWTLGSGCALHRWKHHDDPTNEDVPCTNGQLQIQRRFFVVAQGPVDISGHPGSFADEVVAALNALPGCVAVLLPPTIPVDPLPGIPGPPPELMHFIESPVPSSAIDELLIIRVTEAIPFRPMRLCANIERRSLGDGLPIASQFRTWNSPLDTEPLGPNPFNRFILNHPPPLGSVERQEMSRLSPMTFQQNVARQLAVELCGSPL